MNTKAPAALGQWMTPRWGALAIVERHYSRLASTDLVIEPTCGDGAFLAAIPADVPAIGVEIDPALADQARTRTGRKVITGDFRTVAIPDRPTHLIGNLPFVATTIEGILRCAFELLPNEGTAGFILPAYALQTSSVVIRYASRWNLAVELLPRTLFGRLSKPLVFAMFTKAAERRVMVGLALFEESFDIERMPKPVRETLERGTGSVWLAVVDRVLRDLNGEAGLDAIYGSIAPRRPTQNQYWRAKVRQVLQQPQHFTRTGPARYARRIAA